MRRETIHKRIRNKWKKKEKKILIRLVSFIHLRRSFSFAHTFISFHKIYFLLICDLCFFLLLCSFEIRIRRAQISVLIQIRCCYFFFFFFVNFIFTQSQWIFFFINFLWLACVSFRFECDVYSVHCTIYILFVFFSFFVRLFHFVVFWYWIQLCSLHSFFNMSATFVNVYLSVSVRRRSLIYVHR